MQKQLLGIIYVDFYAAGQLLITFSVFAKYLHNSAVHQLFIDFKAAYDPVGREILHNIPLSLVSPWNW